MQGDLTLGKATLSWKASSSLRREVALKKVIVGDEGCVEKFLISIANLSIAQAISWCYLDSYAWRLLLENCPKPRPAQWFGLAKSMAMQTHLYVCDKAL